MLAQRPYIMSVTGSVGKTTTTGMIATVLSHPTAIRLVGKVQSTTANMNNDVGVPLTILLFDRWISGNWKRMRTAFILPFRAIRLALTRGYPGVLVLEVAAGSYGHVSRAARLAPPDIGVVTTIGPAHLDQFETLAGVAREKGALVRAVPGEGLVILGDGHEQVGYLEQQAKARVIRIAGRGEELASGVARAIAEHRGIPREATLAALATYKPVAGRLKRFELERFIVLDDSYNASPLSMKLGLDTLRETASGTARRVAVLSQMNELGRESARYHREIGEYAHECADVVVGVGELARLYSPHYWFRDSKECARSMVELVNDSDCVLVKGSFSFKMQRVVKCLLESCPGREV